MSTCDIWRRTTASIQRQRLVFAALVLLSVFYAGALLALSQASVNIVDQFHGTLAARRGSTSLPVALDMSRFDTAPYALAPGLGPREARGAWTVGRETTLFISLAQPVSGALVLKARVTPAVSREHPAQSVRVYVNGQDVARWTFGLGEASVERTARIPPQLASRERALRITLQVDKPIPAREVEGSGQGDLRLGLLLHQLRLESELSAGQ